MLWIILNINYRYRRWIKGVYMKKKAISRLIVVGGVALMFFLQNYIKMSLMMSVIISTVFIFLAVIITESL